MRYLKALTAALLLFCGVFLAAQPAAAGPSLVFDVRTGEVLHAYEPFHRWYPASLTKLMTVYVTFDAIQHGLVTMKSPVTISAHATAQPPSKMGFKVGTQITVEDAIRILMVKSANDVAVALAESVGGSEDRFVAGMNTAAARLGMTDTNYVNPHGLPDPRQITSARDLALLTRAIIKTYPQYQDFFEMPSLQVGGRVLKNHNKLIGRFRGADGMKTGFICAGGFNIVSSATRGGRRLVAIVLGATSGRHRDQIAAALLEAGFAQGGGFDLFGRSKTTIADLRRPTNIVQPVDMHPYACQKRTPPAEIASFGFVETPNPDATSSAALALAPDQLRMPSRRVEPVSALAAPLPRTKPYGTDPAAAAPTVDAPTPEPDEVPDEAAAFPFPRPNPLRASQQ